VSKNGISRRMFLKVAALTAGGAAVAACQPQTVIVEKERTVEVEKVVKETVVVEKEKVVTAAAPTPTPAPEMPQEAPEVAELVASGQLPPLEDRLPAEPLTLIRGDGFDQQIGTFGEQMVIGNSGKQQANEFFLTLNRRCSETRPNVGKEWQYSDDGQTLTVYMRRGMKWSDGAPRTADDVAFWWESVVLNEILTPAIPSQWRPGGEVAEFSKLDDYTVEFKFAKPRYYQHHVLDGTGNKGHQFGNAGNGFWLPRHFFEQLHIDYNPKADDLAKENDLEAWNQLFAAQLVSHGNYPISFQGGAPLASCWIKTQEEITGTVWDRNPYYFKVDSAGNQLPYIGRALEKRWEDNQSHLMMMLAGEFDYETWGVDIGDWPVLWANQEKGGYDLWMGGDFWSSATTFWINHTFEGDPELGEIMADKRFRQALSLAIDRDEINEKIFLGLGVPVQNAPYRGNFFTKEEWAKAYVDHDPDRANALLDDMGLTNRDVDGFRTKPGGGELVLIIEVSTNISYWVPTSELVAAYWGAVGVKTLLKTEQSSLQWTRLAANEMHVFPWVSDGMSDRMLLATNNNYVRASWWAPLWYQWFSTGGEQGIQPPDDVMHMLELCDVVDSTPPDQVTAVMQEIWDWAAENVPAIGTVGYMGKPCISNSKLGNVDKESFGAQIDSQGARNNWLEMLYWKE
jgi:peptide/nickel transport system substrate-binding protein